MKTIIFITAFMLIFAVYTIEAPLEQPWIGIAKSVAIYLIITVWVKTHSRILDIEKAFAKLGNYKEDV